MTNIEDVVPCVECPYGIYGECGGVRCLTKDERNVLEYYFKEKYREMDVSRTCDECTFAEAYGPIDPCDHCSKGIIIQGNEPKGEERLDIGNEYIDRTLEVIERTCETCNKIILGKTIKQYCKACRDEPREEDND